MKSVRPSSRNYARPLVSAALAILFGMVGCSKLFGKPHTVTVSWAASKSPVVGYNVYRTAQGDGPRQKLTPQPIAETKYVDSSVEEGRTYFYFVTAVDSKGAESHPSESMYAIVPDSRFAFLQRIERGAAHFSP